MAIWLPEDQNTVAVDWYVSEGKAVGINTVTEQFVRRSIAPPKQTGFTPWSPHQPGDPDEEW